MHIKFFGPFEKLAGKEIFFNLPAPTTLKDFIPLLVSRYQGFKPFAKTNDDASLSAHICFLREGKPLKLSDELRNQDQIQILLPVTGG